MHLKHALFIGVLCSLRLSATEIDSFTDRDPLLRDSSSEVNRIINGYFERAVQNANMSGSCDQSSLVDALNNEFRGLMWSPIEDELTTSPRIDKRRSLVSASVYQDFNAFESPSLAITELGAIVRIGEHFVGSDKFNHFLQLGYDMFDKMYLQGKSFSEVLDWSSWTEQTYYGLWITGVYSYGDLAANYDGLYFWERITNKRLPKGVKPHFACKQGQFHIVTPFDIADYVTAAWDEGINCSRYKTEGMHKKVDMRINMLQAKTGRPLRCPIVPGACPALIEHYGNAARHVLTPLCSP